MRRLYRVPKVAFQKIEYINRYINSGQAQPPYIFLVEISASDAEGFSALWRVILLSTLPDKALTETYLYFGTLEHLLLKEPTPPTATGLPQLDVPSFVASSTRWFDMLIKNNVLKSRHMTIFIIKDYNEDTFDQYLFSPIVDSIGPGILVINVPDDLKSQMR